MFGLVEANRCFYQVETKKLISNHLRRSSRVFKEIVIEPATPNVHIGTQPD